MQELHLLNTDQLIDIILSLRAERDVFLKSSAVGYTALMRVKYDIGQLFKTKLPFMNSRFAYLDEAIQVLADEDRILAEMCRTGMARAVQ